MGRGGEALLPLRVREKLMSANSHRDAAPWISHLGNFIRFWRVTSFLRVRSDRDEIPWGSPSWQLSPLLEPRVFTSCKTYPLSQARAPSVCHACTRSCFCRMQSCGWDGTLRLVILMLVQALGCWQRMPGLLRYLRNCVMEWSGRDRCEGNVRWKGGE